MRKEQLWELRERLREHPATPERSRHCGRTRYQKRVQLVTAGGTAWWQGVLCCRARVCPSCHAARRFQLAREVDFVVNERESEARTQSWLATFTVRHSASDPVSLTRQVRHAWRYVLQSRAWQTFKSEHRCEWIAAEEVTYGDNGFHPHIHALLMPRKPIVSYGDDWPEFMQGETEAESLLRELWERAVRRKVGEQHAPDARHGVDMRPCDSSQYLTKLGLELTDPSQVKGSSALDLLVSGKVDKYMELQRSRARARDITFSRGLRGIRDSMPKSGEIAELADISGSEWGLMLHRTGWRGVLAVAIASKDPETAQHSIAEVMAGRMPKTAPVAEPVPRA